MSGDGILARLRLQRPGFALEVDLALPGRGVTAVFGPSGSGKTTLLRALAGLERAAGEVAVNGEMWQDEKRFLPVHRRPLGFVFQEAALFPHLSVAGNLDFARRRARAGAPAPALDPLLDLLELRPLLGRAPATLSGGERQRVALARALAANPRLLLMDEPLSSLGPAHKREILPYLERLHAALEVPVLYVSHAPDEVARLADHLVVLHGGSTVASGPLAEVWARTDLPVRVGEEPGALLEAVVGARDERWHLLRLDFAGGSLWVRDGSQPVGRRVRVRVLARDVSLSLGAPAGSSIQNILPAVVRERLADEHPALCLVCLQVGEARLLCRLTCRAAEMLEVAPGQHLHVQIKAAAMVE